MLPFSMFNFGSDLRIPTFYFHFTHCPDLLETVIPNIGNQGTKTITRVRFRVGIITDDDLDLRVKQNSLTS